MLDKVRRTIFQGDFGKGNCTCRFSSAVVTPKNSRYPNEKPVIFDIRAGVLNSTSGCSFNGTVILGGKNSFPCSMASTVCLYQTGKKCDFRRTFVHDNKENIRPPPPYAHRSCYYDNDDDNFVQPNVKKRRLCVCACVCACCVRVCGV